MLKREQLKNITPQEFRSLVREGEWTEDTTEICSGYSQANVVIVPKEYAFDFFLFCQRNPRPCPVIDVTEPGDPFPRLMASGADLRMDIPKYRIFKNGEIVDEPTDILDYWRDDLVGFLLGCSKSFVWALKSANISWRRYGAYQTSIACRSAGRFRGNMAVTVRSFSNSNDAIRAIQISSRHTFMHGPPIHIGDWREIGIKELGKPDPFNPYRPILEPPKPGEVIMYWGCGITPQMVAIESKIPFMITHAPAHMFITDKFVEELSVI